MKLTSVFGFDKLFEDVELEGLDPDDVAEGGELEATPSVVSDPFSVIQDFFRRSLDIKAIGGDAHEAAVRSILDSLTAQGRPVFTKSFIGKSSIDDFEAATENCYIEQPSGTHGPPDFILKLNGKYVGIECKSSKNLQPTFNNTLPKPYFKVKGVRGPIYYIFTTSAQGGKTTFFWGGSDVLMTDARRSLLLVIDSVIRKVSDGLSEDAEAWRALRQAGLLPSPAELKKVIEETDSVNMFDESGNFSIEFVQRALKSTHLGFEYYPRRKFIQKVADINKLGGGYFGTDGDEMKKKALDRLQRQFS